MHIPYSDTQIRYMVRFVLKFQILAITIQHLKKAFHIIVCVFSTKALIGDTIFTSPTGDGTAISRGHPRHAKVWPFSGQRKYLHFSVILRPWVLAPSPGPGRNPRPPALQSSALSTELVLPRSLLYFVLLHPVSLQAAVKVWKKLQ